MSDVIIVGSGISGMLVARELCAENISVTIVERAAQTGQESSWAGGGIISPLYPWRYDDAVNRLANWSQQVYETLCTDLFQETGIDPEWTQSGILIITSEIEQAKTWSIQFAQPVEVVDQARLQEIEPVCRPPGDGVWLPGIAQVRNPRLLKALKAYLIKRGVQFVTDRPVHGFLTDGGRVRGVITEQGNMRADRVVVASGAWSQSLLATVDQHLPVVAPVKGQMLLFQASPDLLQHMILNERRYLIPRRDGHILAGSTLEHVGFQKEISTEARESLYAAAIDLVPSLADCAVEHQWAGLRPGSPQGIPYIYEHPVISGLFVNCGHYRNGVVLGPASARLLVDQMLSRPPIVPVAPYSLDARSEKSIID